MKTKLNTDGQIGIPSEIREEDHLIPGDSFDLQRLDSGQYLLLKQSPARPVTIGTGEDGLPIIRTTGGQITSKLVKEIESQGK
jgi:bifunctional DNA-binding transcriptional regulator/antitoxin component of YhaV-PrlF toxin-antitoxin module